MKVLTIFIHGFNISDKGIGTVGKLRSFFAPYGPYVMLSYGWFGLLGTRYKNDKIAKRLNETVVNAKKGGYSVIVVGHSNGCAIIHRASHLYDTPIDKVVYINPALIRYNTPKKGVLAVDVWYSPSDGPVKWAKWLPKSDSRPWGEMGARGYKGNDIRVISFNKEDEFAVSSKEHSDIFEAEKLSYFGPLIAETAIKSIGVDGHGSETI